MSPLLFDKSKLVKELKFSNLIFSTFTDANESKPESKKLFQ
jgi:hypothetical protein